ncbi:hypothetical protein JCM3765_001572 [Sporobolomyces pararoseus]
MDSPYSPLQQTRRTTSSSRSPAIPHRQRHGHGGGGGGSRSPPLVPMPPTTTSHHSQEPLEGPPPDSYDPNYHHHNRHSTDPYYRDYRDPYSGGGYNREESWRQPQQQYYEGDRDRYYHPQHSQQAAPYPPGPPTGYDPYYQHSRYHDPRDPYSYSRDPYSRADYYSNSRDPYYSSRGPPPPAYPPHYPPYQSSAPPPPPPPPASSSTSNPPPPPPPIIPTFPTCSTAVSLGPHPIHGHLDPSSDLSIPILYLARPISTKTFCPLRNRFKDRLELRFVNSLLDLERDLSIVRNQDLANKTTTTSSFSESAGDGGVVGGGEEGNRKKRRKRRIWISAVGGTDSLVQKVWNQTSEKIEWKEIVDLPHLQLELMWEDQRVGELWKEEEEEEERIRRGGEPEGGEGEGVGEEEGLVKEEDEHVVDERSREWEEGKREIEQRELEQGKNLVLPPGKVEELDRVLRAVRGEGDDHRIIGTSANKDEFEVEPDRLGTSRNGERGEAVVDRFENMVKREHVDDHYTQDQYQRGAVGEDETHSRKRSRHDETEEGQDHTAIRAARKKLEAICKAPRRNCVQWAEANRVPVNDETKMVDQEPVLGERHRGVWDLFGQELDDISPQIQVLMARALRDVTYPPRLRLYSTPEAQEQLEEAVPWFTTLLKTIGDRYELAGAASVVPQDPPVSKDPLDSQANTAGPI